MADETTVIDKPVETPVAVEAPDPERVETDAYIAERKERKRKERGGAQVRIDQLVKEKAELEKKLETKPVTEIPKPAEPPVVPPVAAVPPVATPVVPPVAAPVAEPAKPAEPPKEDLRPKPADFAGDNAASEYDVALTQWVMRHTEKVKPKPVETPAAPVPAVDPTRQAEFDSFAKAVTTFTVEHPDYVESINAAVKKGIVIYDPAAATIMKLEAPHIAYWLSRPENELAARRFSALDAHQQMMEVVRIDERLKTVNPKDFVSNAPPPGTRLTGSSFNGNFSLAELSENDSEEYIRRRAIQRKEARRR